MGKILDTLKKAVTTVGDAISNAFSGNSTGTSGGSSTANQNVSPKTAAVQTKNAVQNNPAFEAPQTTTPKTSAVTTKSNSASYNPLANAKQGTLADVQQAEAETASRLASAGITPTYSSPVSTTSKQNAVTTKSNSVSGASNTSDSSWTASNGKTLAEQTKIYEDAKSQFDAASSEDGFKGFGKTKRLAELQQQVEEAKEELDKMTKEKSIYDKALSFKDATDSELAQTWEDIQKRMQAEDGNIKTYDDLISELTGRRDLINLGYATTAEQAAEMTADIAKLQKEIDEYSTKKNEAQKALDDLRGQAADDFTAIQAYLSGTSYLQNKYGTDDRYKTYQELEQRLADSKDSVEQSVLRMDMALMKNGAEYDKYLGYDVKGAEDVIKEIKAQQDALDEEYVALNDELAYAQAGDKTEMSEAQIQLRMNQIKSEQASLQEKTDGLREEIVGAKSVQKLDPYYHLPEAKDFEEYSKKGAAVQNQQYDDTWDSLSGANTWYVQMDNPAKAAREATGKDVSAIDSSYRFMTDEEYNIYNYLLAKDGKAEAEKFHVDILDLLNSREGGKIAENIENANWTIPLLNGYYLEADEAKRAAGTFALAAASGLSQFGHGVSNTVNALAGHDPNPTSSIAYAAAQVREGLKDVGADIYEGGPSLAQAAFDAVSTTANMAPMMLLGLAGGAMAANLPTWAGAALSKVGNAAMAVSAGGNYYEEALQKGYSKKEAGVYAAFAGASEAVLQDVLGGIATLGGAIPNYITGTMLNNIDDAWLRLGAEVLVRDIGEGVEEYAQDVLTPAFYNLAAGDRNTVQIFNNKDAAYSFLLACATTTLLEAGDVYTDTVAMDKLGKPYSAFFNSQSDLIKNAAQWDSDVGELAQKIQRGDVRLNDTNLGKIVAEYAQRGEGDYVNAGVLMSIASDTTTAEDFAAIYAALENPDAVVMDEEAQYIVQSTPGADADWGMQQQALLTALMNGSQLSDAGWRLLDVTNPAVQEVFSKKTGAHFGNDLTEEEAKAVFEQTAQTITNWKESMAAAMEDTKKAAADTTERIKQAWMENTGETPAEATGTQDETAVRVAAAVENVQNDQSLSPKERAALTQQLQSIEQRLDDPQLSPREKAAALAELAQLEQRVQASTVSPRETAAIDDELQQLMEKKADPNLSPREIAHIDERIRELGEQKTDAEKKLKDRAAVAQPKAAPESLEATEEKPAETPEKAPEKPATPAASTLKEQQDEQAALRKQKAQEKRKAAMERAKQTAKDLSPEQAKEETNELQKSAKRAETMSKAEAERRVATFREGLRKMTDEDLDKAETEMAKMLDQAKKGTAERNFLEQATLEIVSEHARRLNNRAKVQSVEDMQDRGEKTQPVVQTEKTPAESKQKAAAQPKAKEVTDSGTGTPATRQTETEAKQTAAAQKKATPEEKAKAKEERLKRWYKDELDKTKSETPERQQYLKAEYEKNKDFYESLDVGDTIYAGTEDGVIPVGKVTEKTEDGVGITFYDNKGAFSGRSRILTKEGTLSYHEGEIPTLLANGVDLEKADGTRTHYGPEFATEAAEAPVTTENAAEVTEAPAAVETPAEATEAVELEAAVAEAETGKAQPAKAESIPEWYDESMGNLEDKVTYANGSSYTRQQWIERGMERFGKTAAEANEGFNRKLALQNAQKSAAELASQPAQEAPAPVAVSAEPSLTAKPKPATVGTTEAKPLTKKQQALVDAFNENAQSVSDSDLNDLIDSLTGENGVAPAEGSAQRELLDQLIDEMTLREQEAAEAQVGADLIRNGQINRIRNSDLVAIYDYMTKHDGFKDITEQVRNDLINRGYERYVERIDREAAELSAAGRAEPLRNRNSGRAGVDTAGDVGSSSSRPAGNGGIQGSNQNVGDTGGTGSVPSVTGNRSKQPVRLEAGQRIGKGLHVPKGMQYADTETTRTSVGERLYDALERTGLKIVGVDVLCDENGKPVAGGTIIKGKNSDPTIYVSLKHGDYTSSTPYTARGIALHEAVHQWLSRAFGGEHAAKAAEFVKGIIQSAGISAKESTDLFEGYAKQTERSYPDLAQRAKTDQDAAKRFRNQVWEEILGDMVGGEPFSFVRKLGLYGRGIGYFARQAIEDAKLIEQSMETTGNLPTNARASYRNGGGIDTLRAEPLARDDIYGWTDDMVGTEYKPDEDISGRNISSEKIQFALGETARKIGDLVGNKNTVVRALLELNRDFWTDGYRTGLPENVAAVQEALLANNDETLTKAWLDEVDKIRSMYASAIEAARSSSSQPVANVSESLPSPEAEREVMEQYSLFEPEPVVQEISNVSPSRRASGTSRSRRRAGRVLEDQLSMFEPIPAVHPDIQARLDRAQQLETKVLDFFKSVPEDSELYLAPEEIDSMMEANPYAGAIDGDMENAEQIVMNLSDLAKTQTGKARQQTYELMEQLVSHLPAVRRTDWTEARWSKDSDFTDWYSQKHPSMYYPGYVPGRMIETRERRYLRDYIERDDITDEDRQTAKEMLDRLNENRDTGAYGIFYKPEDTSDLDEPLAKFTTNTEKALNDPKNKIQNAFNKEGNAKADNLKSIIQKLVRPQEMLWTGLNYFFDEHKGQTVTKQDVLDFIHANNVQVEQTGYHEGGQPTGGYTEYISQSKSRSLNEALNQLSRNLEFYPQDYNLDYGDYTGEPLVTVENPDGTISVRLRADGPEITWLSPVTRKGTSRWGGPEAIGGRYDLRGGTNYREYTYKYGNREGSSYTNDSMRAHWEDEDLLGHARMQDFTTPDGKKVLLIEEVQSDWANARRKNGKLEDNPEYQALVEESKRLDDEVAHLRNQAFGWRAEEAKRTRGGKELIQGLRNQYHDVREQAEQAYLNTKKYMLGQHGLSVVPVDTVENVDGQDVPVHGFSVVDAQGNYVQNQTLRNGRVVDDGQMIEQSEVEAAEKAAFLRGIGEPAPDMPFGQDYYKFILKDLLYKAANGDYDYIAWATPEMQSSRYYGDNSQATTYQEYRYDFRTPEELKAARAGMTDKERSQSGPGPIQSFLQTYMNSNHWGSNMQEVRLDSATDNKGNKVETVPAMELDPKMKEAILYEDQPMYKPEDDVAYGTELGYAPVFYDKLQKVVEAQFPNKLGAQQVEGWLRGKGVKEEDIKWMGIRQFVEGKKNITKDELLDFLSYTPEDLLIEPEILEGDQTRWGSYTMNGGENYREILWCNESGFTNEAMSIHWGKTFGRKDGHPGVLVHARVQDHDMVDPETGEVLKTLFVDEIQSDWHNAGQKYGYQDPSSYTSRKNTLQNLIANFKSTDAAEIAEAFGYGDSFFDGVNTFERLAEKLDMIRDRITYQMQYAEDEAQYEEFRRADATLERFYNWATSVSDSEQAPEAPFSKTYHEYVMKNLLRMAAEEGYDAIGWTSAQQQIDRWSKAFEKGYRIEYDQDIPKFMQKYGKQWGAKVSRDTDYTLSEVDPVLYSDLANATWDVASYSQALENPDLTPARRKTLEGNLAFAEQEVARLKPEAEKVAPWVMPLTEELKNSVLYEGQPLFKPDDQQAAADAGVNLDEAFPEGSLERTLLEMMRTGQTSMAQAYIQGLVDRAKNPTYTEEPSPAFTPVTDEELGNIRDRQSALIDRYGRLEPGEEPARDINVAQQQNDTTRTRRHAPHVAESKNVPEHTAQALERFVATDEAASYVRIPDKEATNYADALIKRKGIEKCMKEWDGIASAGHNPTKYDIALGETLALWAAHNGRDDLACKIWADLNVMGTQAGQVVQAMSLIKKMSPEYQAYYIRKVVDNLNEQYKGKIMHGWKGMTEITIDQDLEDAVVNASTQEELQTAMDKLIADIAEQIPASFKEKWDSWRYFAMLGNPRTHVRNILGNTVFAPLVFGKNLLAAGMEKFIPEDQRTKAILGRGKYMDFARQDFQEMRDIITGEGNKYTSPRDAIMKKRQIWKTGLMNGLTKAVGDALNAEDTWFLKPYYTNALAGFLAARNADLETLQTTPEGRQLWNEARQYAVNEAQKATYRDASVVAQALNKIKKVPGIGWLLDGIMPFTGTPVNILKRGIEYSPVGLLKTLTYNASQLAKGDINASKFIDNLSSGMTGTMVAMLGFWLAQAGILRGGDDDDDKRNGFLKNMGFQNFSINLDINGTPGSYTIDWAAPSALPLFTGAAAYKLFAKDHELSATDIGDALLLLADPMMQLSMLDGLNRTLSSLSYASTSEMVSTLATEMATSYLGQAVPTLLGQIARTVDDTRRSSYTDKNSDVPKWLQYFIQSSVQSKIPVWEEDKMAYVDFWGRREVNSNVVLRALENFLSPGYYNEISITPVDEELNQLSMRTGNSDILPTKGGKYFSVEGERKDMTAEEFQHFCEESGQVKYALLNYLFNDKRYADAPDDVKAALIEDMYKYANASAKYHIDSNYNINGQGKWIKEAESSGNVYESIMNSRYADRMENIGGIELPNSMKPQGGLTDSQYSKWQQYGEDAGVEAYEFADALQAANVDENSSVSQDEMGSYLSEMIRAGGLDEQQAEAIWNSNGWKTSYGEWAGKHPNATVAGTQAIKEGAAAYGMSTTAYQRYQERAEPYGVSIESYVTAITASDTDGNGSLKQDELGTYLNQQVRAGQMSQQQAEAVWNATGKWKTSYSTWYNKGNNAYRNEGEGAPTWEELMEMNEARGDNYTTEGAPATQEEYDQDYLSRGYAPMRTGDLRQLVSLDDDTAERANEIIDALVHMYGDNEGGRADGYATDMLYDYLVLGPDYEGQSFEDYMQTYASGKTARYRRNYQPGTGTKASVRGEGLSTTGLQGAAGGATQAAAVAKRARTAVAKRKR